MSAQSLLLKQEIRRLEANEERTKVAEDLEYLKNVIIKFIMAEDEQREPLIPVLGMLLKFTSQEQQSAVAGYKKALAAASDKMSGAGQSGSWW